MFLTIISSGKTRLMYSRGLPVLLVLVFILSIVVLAYPVPVHAAGITISSASGTVGTSVEVSGNGFSGRLADVHWDNQVILSKVPISETGELTCNLIVPSACRGTHAIKITDDSNWTSSTASATFNVLPGITIFPRIGRAYTQITVIGNGFTCFERDIKVTWNGNVITGSATSNHLGTWGITFDAPEFAKGEYYIGAFSTSTSATDVSEHKFIVGPFAKAQPSSGPVGTEITVDAFGFRTSEDGITITWDNKIILCNIIAGTDGIFSTTLNIPPSTRGQHQLGVFGSDFTPRGTIPDIDFNVVPGIALQPTSGNKGTSVTVNGSGFAKDETITLSFEGKPLDAKATADNAGSFNVTFEVLQSRVKDNKVRATGSAGNSAEAIFVMEKIAPLAPALLFPEQRAKLEIFDSVGDVFLGTAKLLIGVIGFGDSGQRASGSSRVTFGWSAVNAESDITYTLEIARGNDFSSQILLKEGLADSEYNLSRDDALGRESYRWRVKAVDDIGNESPWSKVQEFEVIPMSNQVFVLSMIIPILVIATIVAAVILTWRIRRLKRDNRW